jgi:hypothetical protein
LALVIFQVRSYVLPGDRLDQYPLTDVFHIAEMTIVCH